MITEDRDQFLSLRCSKFQMCAGMIHSLPIIPKSLFLVRTRVPRASVIFQPKFVPNFWNVLYVHTAVTK